MNHETKKSPTRLAQAPARTPDTPAHTKTHATHAPNSPKGSSSCPPTPAHTSTYRLAMVNLLASNGWLARRNQKKGCEREGAGWGSVSVEPCGGRRAGPFVQAQKSHAEGSRRGTGAKPLARKVQLTHPPKMATNQMRAKSNAALSHVRFSHGNGDNHVGSCAVGCINSAKNGDSPRDNGQRFHIL